LTPLAAVEEQRPVFLSVGREGWPRRDELTTITITSGSDSTIRLLAPLPPQSESLPESDYPVLWRLAMPASELQPWEDPGTASAALQRIGARDSLGFLDASFLTPGRLASANGSAARIAMPTFDDAWFRLLLLGRMGYSPDVPEEYWVQQFAGSYGPRAGLGVYAAASHSRRILDSLPRADAFLPVPTSAGAPPADLTDSARQLHLLQSFLLDSNSGLSGDGILAQALRERNWLLPGEPLPQEEIADICASFQRVVVETLVDRLFDAARAYGARSVGIAGGVSAYSLVAGG